MRGGDGDQPIVIDGVPKMSDNCVDVLDEKLAGAERFLEWGSGNSTLYVLEHHRHVREIVSIEHDPGYYRAVLESLGRHLKARGPVAYRMADASDCLRPMAEIRERAPDLESDLVKFHYLAGQRTLVCGTARFRPQAVLSRLLRLTLFGRLRGRPRSERFSSTAKSIEAVMQRLAEADRPHVLTTIEADGRRVRYFLLRQRQPVHRGTSDGLYADFYDYVDLRLDDRFDVILVDGRARTSVLKRIHRDGLLAPGGALLCHDAYRTHLYEGFRLFEALRFLDGSNSTARGEPFTSSAEAFLISPTQVKDELCVFEEDRAGAASENEQ